MADAVVLRFVCNPHTNLRTPPSTAVSELCGAPPWCAPPGLPEWAAGERSGTQWGEHKNKVSLYKVELRYWTNEWLFWCSNLVWLSTTESTRFFVNTWLRSTIPTPWMLLWTLLAKVLFCTSNFLHILIQTVFSFLGATCHSFMVAVAFSMLLVGDLAFWLPKGDRWFLVACHESVYSIQERSEE